MRSTVAAAADSPAPDSVVENLGGVRGLGQGIDDAAVASMPEASIQI